MTAREVILDGGSPWGFRMHGGADVHQPLRISRVNPGSKASIKGVREGDLITSINGQSTRDVTNSEAHLLLKSAGDKLKLGLNEDCSGSPKRRQYKTVLQESHSEVIRRSSISSSTTFTVRTTKEEEIIDVTSQKVSSMNDESDNKLSDKTKENGVVSQRSTLSSSDSVQTNGSDNKGAVSMADSGNSRRKRNRRANKKKSKKCKTSSSTEEELIEMETETAEYRVDSPQTVQENGKSEKGLVKSRSLDSEEALKITELSESSSESEEKSNECSAVVAELDPEVDWEITGHLELEKAESNITPREEADLRNFLVRLDLVTTPEQAIKIVTDTNSKSDNVKERRAKKKEQLATYFLPVYQNPRYLEAISEEGSDLSDREIASKKRAEDPLLVGIKIIEPQMDTSKTVICETSVLETSEVAEVVHLDDSSSSNSPVAINESCDSEPIYENVNITKFSFEDNLVPSSELTPPPTPDKEPNKESEISHEESFKKEFKELLQQQANINVDLQNEKRTNDFPEDRIFIKIDGTQDNNSEVNKELNGVSEKLCEGNNSSKGEQKVSLNSEEDSLKHTNVNKNTCRTKRQISEIVSQEVSSKRKVQNNTKVIKQTQKIIKLPNKRSETLRKQQQTEYAKSEATKYSERNGRSNEGEKKCNPVISSIDEEHENKSNEMSKLEQTKRVSFSEKLTQEKCDIEQSVTKSTKISNASANTSSSEVDNIETFCDSNSSNEHSKASEETKAKNETNTVEIHESERVSSSLSSDSDSSSIGTTQCTAYYNPMTSSITEVDSLVKEAEEHEAVDVPALKEICLKRLVSLPFGTDMLEELAEVSLRLEEYINSLPQKQFHIPPNNHVAHSALTNKEDVIHGETNDNFDITALEGNQEEIQVKAESEIPLSAVSENQVDIHKENNSNSSAMDVSEKEHDGLKALRSFIRSNPVETKEYNLMENRSTEANVSKKVYSKFENSGLELTEITNTSSSDLRIGQKTNNKNDVTFHRTDNKNEVTNESNADEKIQPSEKIDNQKHNIESITRKSETVATSKHMTIKSDNESSNVIEIPIQLIPTTVRGDTFVDNLKHRSNFDKNASVQKPNINHAPNPPKRKQSMKSKETIIPIKVETEHSEHQENKETIETEKSDKMHDLNRIREVPIRIENQQALLKNCNESILFHINEPTCVEKAQKVRIIPIQIESNKQTSPKSSNGSTHTTVEQFSSNTTKSSQKTRIIPIQVETNDEEMNTGQQTLSRNENSMPLGVKLSSETNRMAFEVERKRQEDIMMKEESHQDIRTESRTEEVKSDNIRHIPIEIQRKMEVDGIDKGSKITREILGTDLTKKFPSMENLEHMKSLRECFMNRTFPSTSLLDLRGNDSQTIQKKTTHQSQSTRYNSSSKSLKTNNEIPITLQKVTNIPIRTVDLNSNKLPTNCNKDEVSNLKKSNELRNKQILNDKFCNFKSQKLEVTPVGVESMTHCNNLQDSEKCDNNSLIQTDTRKDGDPLANILINLGNNDNIEKKVSKEETMLSSQSYESRSTTIMSFDNNLKNKGVRTIPEGVEKSPTLQANKNVTVSSKDSKISSPVNVELNDPIKNTSSGDRSRHSIAEEALLKAHDLSEWLQVARANNPNKTTANNPPENTQNIRRRSLPHELYVRQMQYLIAKEKLIQQELESLEEEKRNLNSAMYEAAPVPLKQFEPSDYRISKSGDLAELREAHKQRPLSVEQESFRQLMYDEYRKELSAREDRKHKKVIRISLHGDEELNSKPAQNINANNLEHEFMNKVKERMDKFGLKRDDSNDNTDHDDQVPVLIMDGDEITTTKKLPKHLQELVDITQHGDGVWSPGQKQEFSAEELKREVSQDSSSSVARNDEAAPAVWTPRSAGSSPTAERKEFRPLNFESPVLGRKVRTKSDGSATLAEPPWRTSDSEGPLSPVQKRLPTSYSAPGPGFSDVSGAPRLPKAQNPTITLLQKAREGQIPKAAAYSIDQERTRSRKNEPSYASATDIAHQVHSDQVETDNDRQRKFITISPKKYDGVGPTTKDGMPLILRSEVRDANMSQWYKKMYDTIHKQPTRHHENDEYVTVRYKQRRGRYPYSTTGYLSEPEPGAYDSDATLSDNKYATLDRRRPPTISRENEYSMSSTLPRNTTVISYRPSDVQYVSDPYKNQPGRIENYTPGQSSISDKEAKKWWDEVMDIFDGWLDDHSAPPNYNYLLNKAIMRSHLEQQRRLPQTKGFMSQALKESGYESDSTLVFRRRDDTAQQLSPMEQREVYKNIQKGGDVPLHGLRKTAPERPKEPEAPPPPPKGHYDLTDSAPESPRKYVENEVTIHYKTPVRQEVKEALSEDELAHRQAMAMRKIYEEERRRKYLQELQDMTSRRHTDNFIPSQKSPISLTRYDDFLNDLGPRVKPRPRSPETRLVARALYNFVGQTERELTFKKGDIIYIKRQVDKNWYQGEFNAMVGLFPANYVEIIPYDGMKSTPRKSHEGQARAKYNFIAQTHLELSLAKGELVVITRRVDDNWYEGKIGGRKGIFPVSYVEILIDPGESQHSPLPSKPVASPAAHSMLLNGSSGGKESMGSHSYVPTFPTQDLGMSYRAKPIQITSSGTYGSLKKNPMDQALHIETQSDPIPYRALYKYRPQNEDELELMEGDTVYVLEKCDDGWYVGSSERTGAFGTFPGNYVERI